MIGTKRIFCWLLPLCAAVLPVQAETLRIATYDPSLTRDGPGLLLRDLTAGRDRQIDAVVAVIAGVSPDILLLTGFDWDLQGAALRAFQARLADAGADYDHLYAPRPNTGMATGLDLDGDGRKGGPRDAQGYGLFSGADGMALLSRLPIRTGEARDFSAFLWNDLPDSLIDGADLTPEARALQRLSTTAHWDVPVTLPDGSTLSLRSFAATPPVFDGPEDRNGRRNHDETAFWLRYQEGRLPVAPHPGPFIVLGYIGLDPAKGEGRRPALQQLMARMTDPLPEWIDHSGDRSSDTADYGDSVGRLRVDYVLPSSDLTITGSGVYWPAGAEGETAARASRHRLVWVDVALP
ncbi:endonuclease/exonuclease/phosphatase family protein [Paenirhodobacter populi]|uniref:endonuclease/exonuclease/phosphatase family protein n=1 Tax=Paenirhodobacter populi TaxID=2306993 RepID=UPI0013E3461A|nr:endonuclease/exonuclease/phosphatase family protein [Sinirhodobacter populi]